MEIPSTARHRRVANGSNLGQSHTMRHIILPLILLISSPAEAKPAWDEASKYVCRAEALRDCKASSATCNKEPGTAVFLVDFAAGTFKPFDSDARFAEHIVSKQYKEYSVTPATHVVMLDGGARMLQFTGSLKTNGTSRSIPAVFIAAYGDEVLTHYLTCSPAD